LSERCDPAQACPALLVWRACAPRWEVWLTVVWFEQQREPVLVHGSHGGEIDHSRQRVEVVHVRDLKRAVQGLQTIVGKPDTKGSMSMPTHK